MADSLADLKLRILLLPPISRGTHLAGPALHARRLVELWGGEGGDDLPLTEAFRLLDSDVVTGVILRTLYASDREYINPHPRYWVFPSLADLLPELRDLSWQAMLTGALLVEAAKGVGGKRYPVVLPAELLRLAPDWDLSRLTRDGQDEFLNVRVRRTPAESVKKAWRDPVPRAELKAATETIARACGKQLSERAFWEKLKAETGRLDLSRQQARTALNEYAPQLKIHPGYHVKPD